MKKEQNVPIAADITPDEHGIQATADAPQPPVPVPIPPIPIPPFKICTKDLQQGCFKITYRPSPSILLPYYAGTLRVENKAGGGKTVSGDLYKFPGLIIVNPIPPILTPSDADDGSAIPVYARNKYYSYLRGTSYSRPSITLNKCTITVEFEEFVYNAPPSGSFNGSFNSAFTRKIKIVVEPTADDTVFTGRLYEGTVDKGAVDLKWVSKYFRRGVVEIDTVAGAVAPQPLNPGTPSEESFTTVFETVGWRMTPVYNETGIPAPAGQVPTNCWSDGVLHGLMLARRSSAVTLDSEWRYHMLAVPGKLGCSRGKMYDLIGTHREGCVTYSDDGYPTSDSSNFGVAANKKQREFPRAFLRSASHELGHTCNMQHQELEGGADNSIMTTTPSVADVLGGPATGAPGVFPTNINLGFNEHCRHHLIHFPDPVVRPGCMNWQAGHPTLGGAFAPSADGGRVFIPAESVLLSIKTQSDHVKLGEPLLMAWEVTNQSNEDFYMPNDVGLNIEYTQVSVTDADGLTTDIPTFVLECEHSSIKKLEPGKKLAAATNLFWGSKGFAFTKPGKHRIDLSIRWTYKGVPYGLHNHKSVWVDYPVTEKDNDIAAAMMDKEVGMFVALGGDAYHLTEGVARIESVMKIDPKHPVAKSMAKFYSAEAHAAFIKNK